MPSNHSHAGSWVHNVPVLCSLPQPLEKCLPKLKQQKQEEIHPPPPAQSLLGLELCLPLISEMKAEGPTSLGPLLMGRVF